MENEREIHQEAELRRLNSETARNEAEKKKLLSEAREINKRVSQKVFHLKEIIKVIIGAIVAAALLAAWAIEYLKPLLEKNQELSTLENKILAAENKEQIIRVEESKQALEKLKDSTNKELQQLQIENDYQKLYLSQSEDLIRKLNERFNEIYNAYQNLSREKQTTEKERAKYSKLAAEASSQSKVLKAQLDKITSAQHKTENRGVGISDQLLSNWLLGESWSVTYNTLYFDNVGVLKFMPNGKLEHNYKLNEKDSWQLTAGKLTLNLDNSKWVTQISQPNPTYIKGRASNPSGDSWLWELWRLY